MTTGKTLQLLCYWSLCTFAPWTVDLQGNPMQSYNLLRSLKSMLRIALLISQILFMYKLCYSKFWKILVTLVMECFICFWKSTTLLWPSKGVIFLPLARKRNGSGLSLHPLKYIPPVQVNELLQRNNKTQLCRTGYFNKCPFYTGKKGIVQLLCANWRDTEKSL